MIKSARDIIDSQNGRNASGSGDLYSALYRVCLALDVSLESAGLNRNLFSESVDNVAYRALPPELASLASAGRAASVVLQMESELSAKDIFELANNGMPVVFLAETEQGDHEIVVVESSSGRLAEVSVIANDEVKTQTTTLAKLRYLASHATDHAFLIASRDLQCDSLSSADTPHKHLTPLQRFYSLLRLDSRDIGLIALFGGVAGALSLSSPLAIESLVNIVSWGTYTQPLFVVAVMLMMSLGIAGILRVLQAVLVEVIQRRQIVRIVADLAHRFPRASQKYLQGKFPREFANRVFDIMTIQKASATLLMDGVTLVLTTILGMVLLAFYHPFLLGFDLILVTTMVLVTWLLGRNGISTAIDESAVKYKIAAWLQDVLSSPAAFKVNGGENLAIEQSNRLAADYIAARKDQFRVVLRQSAFAIMLQAIALTSVLGLGGYLVIVGELTLGQLVASELIVTVVVGAFAKAGKSIEKFYDLMAGIDKVGYLLDVPVDSRTEVDRIPDGPAQLSWPTINIKGKSVESAAFAPGAVIAITGDDTDLKSALASSIAGLTKPNSGTIDLGGIDPIAAASGCEGEFIGYAADAEILHATLRQNVDLGRTQVGQSRVRDVLQSVDLWDTVRHLPNGMQTKLVGSGYPLSKVDSQLLCVARAIAAEPRLLVIERTLDYLDHKRLDRIWAELTTADVPWTLVVVTTDPNITERCDEVIHCDV